MTDIEQKALALVNAVEKNMGLFKSKALSPDNPAEVALCRAIEQHEAFRQEVSDALMANTRETPSHVFGLEKWVDLQRFIIPAPKPDPLVEVLRSVGGDDRDYCDYDIYVKEIRAALEARGLEIREKNDG